MKAPQNSRTLIFILIGVIVLGLCTILGIATTAGYYLLRPTATPPPASPTPTPSSTLSPTLRPSLTPLPGQKAHFPTQTALAMTQTAAAGYSPTPPSATPTPARPTFTPGPSLAPTRVIVTLGAYTPGSACNPSYPSLCLTARFTCQQIGITNFTVLPPDPFGYDKDGDGLGCDN